MYIEDRLFSENTEETLYSVIMTEPEYDLYSEFCEALYSDDEDDGSNTEKIAKAAGIGGAAAAAGAGLGYAGAKMFLVKAPKNYIWKGAGVGAASSFFLGGGGAIPGVAVGYVAKKRKIAKNLAKMKKAGMIGAGVATAAALAHEYGKKKKK